jgi:hypothetical protein
MRALCMLVVMCQCVAAHNCSVELGKNRFDTETETELLCFYVQYHALMLVTFSCVFVATLPITLVFILLYKCLGKFEKRTKRCIKFSITSFVLMFGPEPMLAAIILLFIDKQVRKCSSTPTRSAVYAEPGTPVLEEASDEVVVISILPEDPTPPRECSICLQSDSDPYKWFTTPCKHSFHLACISTWTNNTCPLCRKLVNYGEK